MSGHQIRVAILGGSLAGSFAMHALLKNPNLDVHIFESAPTFRESGNAISFGKNAIAALELMGLRDRLTAAKSIQSNGARCIIAQGKDTGKLAFDNKKTGGISQIVQRSLFLGELLKDIDESRLHSSKKMKNMTQEDNVVLEFEDGSFHTCDILIGADGIHSLVRKYVVGEDPSAEPSFAGWQTVWTVVPFDLAQRHLGRDLINTEDPAQYAWCGKNTWLMHSQISDNTLENCVFNRRFEGDLERNRKTNREELYSWVKDFDHPVGRSMAELITEGRKEVGMFPFQHHNPQAPRCVNDRVAIIGDAADSTTPWRGSGGAMSLEDALVLGACFEKVATLSDARAALKGYEAVRRPRRSRLVMESYRAGMIFCGCDESGLDSQKMNDKLNGSWDWILDIDLKERIANSLEVMKIEKEYM